MEELSTLLLSGEYSDEEDDVLDGDARPSSAPPLQLLGPPPPPPKPPLDVALALNVQLRKTLHLQLDAIELGLQQNEAAQRAAQAATKVTARLTNLKDYAVPPNAPGELRLAAALHPVKLCGNQARPSVVEPRDPQKQDLDLQPSSADRKRLRYGGN